MNFPKCQTVSVCIYFESCANDIFLLESNHRAKNLYHFVSLKAFWHFAPRKLRIFIYPLIHALKSITSILHNSWPPLLHYRISCPTLLIFFCCRKPWNFFTTIILLPCPLDFIEWHTQNTEDLWHLFISDGETINFLLEEIVELRLCQREITSPLLPAQSSEELHSFSIRDSWRKTACICTTPAFRHF